METKHTNKLKIHKLSQEQYDREKEAGRLDNSAIYLTPYESDGSSTGSSNNASSHKVYYDIMRDTTAVWGDNNGAIVVIPEGTTEIANGPYSNNTKVKVVAIPYGVTTIGDYAFCQCSSLTSVKIPDSVTSIGNHAFWYCSRLTSVEIPSSVTSIGDSAFNWCQKLSDVYITDIDAWCNIDFGGGPSDPTSYDANPLYYAKNLYLNNELVTELVIPDTVTEIKPYAFYGCNSLTSVEIPDSVTSIGKGVFDYCTSLTSAVIGDGVTSISDSMFADCENLTSIELPESVTSIGKYAFVRCFNLPNITIPNNVTSIGEDAFFACRKLTDIEISSNVNSIGESAFGSCEKLSTITVAKNNTVYKSIDNVLYTKDGRTLMQYAPAKSETSFTIPSSVTNISHRAFASCVNLSSIVIPDGVTSVGSYAFYNCDKLASVVIGNGITNIDSYTFNMCYKLQNVTIGSSVTNIGSNAFTSIPYGAVITILATTPPALDTNAFSDPARIIVPEGSLQAYCEAEVWRDFIRVIEDTAGNKFNVEDFSEIHDLINSDLATNLADGESAYVTLDTDVDVMWANENSNVTVVNNSSYPEYYLAVDLSNSNLDEWTDQVKHSDNLVFSGDDPATLRREGGTLILKPSRIDDFYENAAEWSEEEVFINFPMYETYTQLDDAMSSLVTDNHMPCPVALKLTESNISSADVVDDDFFGIKLLDDNGEDTGDYIYIYRHTNGVKNGHYEGYLDQLPSPGAGWGNCAIYGYMMQWPADGDQVMYPICICRLDENDNPMETIDGV